MRARVADFVSRSGFAAGCRGGLSECPSPDENAGGALRRREVVRSGVNFVRNVSLVVRISLFLHQ